MNDEEGVNRASKTFNIWRVLVYALILSIIFNSWVDYRASNDTHSILEEIDRQTSPQRQAEQQARLGELLIVVDCNNRRALQDAFIAQGIAIEILYEECGGD